MKYNLINRVLLLSWISLSLIVFFSSFKEQLLINSFVKKQIGTIFPEGWGFFTKNPRDLHLEVYKIENNELKYISMSNHSKKSLIGLSRSPRVIGYEASMTINEIPLEKWKKGSSINLEQYVNDTVVIVKQKEHFKYLIKGEYLFKLYKLVPYAWAKKNQDDNNPFTIIKIKVE